MTHDQLQAQCWAYAWNNCPPNWRRLFFAIPNGAMGLLKPNQSRQMRACGVLAGVWDMPIFDLWGRVHWIEFKVGKDWVSDSQKAFRAAMIAIDNHFFYVVEDVQRFVRIFTAIINKDDLTLKELQYNDE